jgi:FkbM family methyltransferase
MKADLIFDVGMNNGDDTAYYLFKGFRVVAIDADPTLIECARQRFAEPIRQGRLELVNAAIGPQEATAPFWICEGKSEWNSFDRQIASRNGLSCHAIEVRCRPFRDLLRQYGVPYYLKIDIEGHDQYCIADLDRRDLPKYVSLEMGHVEHLWALRDVGYKNFKLITQNDHSQLAVDLFSTKAFVRRELRRYPRVYRLASRFASHCRQLRSASAEQRNVSASSSNGHRWQFPMGSSGPFGEDTDGPWRTLDETAYTWVTYELGRSSYGQPSLDIWHDVHATSAGPGRRA